MKNIVLGILAILLLVFTPSIYADQVSTSEGKYKTLESLVNIIDSSSVVDTNDQKEESTFGVDYTSTTKAHSIRIRSDGSRLVIVTENIKDPTLTLIAGKIIKLLPELDLEGMKLEEDNFGNPKNWSSYFNISVIHEDERFVSLVLDYEVYTGGAHGQHGKLGFVIDKKKKRFVRLNELFHEQRLIKKIGPEWMKQIKKELGEGADEEWIARGTRGSSQFQSFVITGTDLIVYGQSYQHNSYAEGEKTLKYPLSQLKNLKKKYR